MSAPNLTSHLLSLHTTPSYIDATRHTFLTQAGNGSLPLPRLALWLSQDRIYAAHAYPRFIGSLISRIPFQEIDPISGTKERQNQAILEVLVKCLDNIVQEVTFFRDTAEQSGLNMEGWIERKGTRDYTAEMARVASSAPLEDGLVFLWAMERVYFDAWCYVKHLQQVLPKAPSEESCAPAVRRFAANWSSPEFEAFVNTLTELVDSLGISPGSDAWLRAEAIWHRVVELEVSFWPEDGEELHMRKKAL
ncbi:hypothetical protein CVT26_006016 [Gymnopilus dilepis]|uniref:Thiaminase-2/PQQC domain-containing protein n=1 Tax=Gymnopilus dilepis TaxID=231916 RepID=A0A409Y1G2_9AGAR|nr:hypothetical protein CVT26_006016 [Gymnopilus dilepis]